MTASLQSGMLSAQVSLQRNDVDTPSITLHTPPRDLQAPPRPSSPDLLGRSLHPPLRLIRPAQHSPLPLLLARLGTAVPLLRCFSVSWTLSHRGLPARRRVSITLLSWRDTRFGLSRARRTRRTKMRSCLVRGRKGHGRPSPFPAHRATLAGERVSVVLTPELCLANKNPSCQITTEDSRAPLFFSGYVALHSLRIYTRVDAQYTRGHHSTP